MKEKEFLKIVEKAVEKHSALVQEFYDSIPEVDGVSMDKSMEEEIMPSLCYFAEWLITRQGT